MKRVAAGAPTIADIWAARPIVAEVALRTPLVRLQLDDGPEQPEIYLKLENLQPTGSFKLRGAHNAMRALAPAELAHGVLAASTGNMAQAVAFGARRLGVPCTVVVPDDASRAKQQRVEQLGGQVLRVSRARWWQTFQERSYPGYEDAAFIHAFDDARVMAGAGTIGLEILEDLPDVDAVVLPFGGGGLASGVATALRALRPATRVYAAEVATAAPLAAAFAAGAPREVAFSASFVDGIGSTSVFPRMWEFARQLLDGALVASVAQAEAAIRLLVERQRVIAEGAGGCAVAVALDGQAGSGKIVCVVSGGNLGLDTFAGILSR
jgi:threonine dehydratase